MTDFGKDTRDYITDYIKFADAKAGAVLALGSGIAAVIGSAVDRSVVPLRHTPIAIQVLVALVGILFVVTTVMVVWESIHAVIPRTTSAQQSLASFPDIATQAVDAYVASCEALTEPAIQREYSKANASLSRVANAKYDGIRKAVTWLRVQLLSGYLLFLIAVVLRFALASSD
jgi:hypothetical protein